MKRFLLCIDLRSPDAQTVLQAALPWVIAGGATLDVVFVDRFGNFDIASMESTLRAAIHREQENQAAQDLDALRDLLAGVPEAHRGEGIRRAGVPDLEASELAVDYDAVLVGKGKQGLSRMIVGSVSAKLIRRCPVPIIVLPHT